MIKLAFFVVRRPEFTAEQFREHAVNVHVPESLPIIQTRG